MAREDMLAETVAAAELEAAVETVADAAEAHDQATTADGDLFAPLMDGAAPSRASVPYLRA